MSVHDQHSTSLISEMYVLGLEQRLKDLQDQLEAAKVEIIDWKLAKADSDRERDELAERSRWYLECWTSSRILVDRLAQALRPYVENAAPHEQLFNGQDLRNFQKAEAAILEYEASDDYELLKASNSARGLA